MSFVNNNSVHQVSFKTCGSIYRRWEKEGKFRKLAKGDLEFNISYIDTYKNISSTEATSMPTVVALHGSPGSYEDFSALTSHLHEKGMRVVAPNFPDFSTYEPGVFKHSEEEKTLFIKEFLNAICIKQVDALIVHSSAIYPGLILCLEKSPLVKSLVMLNPGSFTINTKAWTTNVLRSMRLLILLSELPFLFKLLKVLGPPFLRMIGIPLRTNNVSDPLLSSYAVLHANIPEEKKHLH